MDKGKRPLMEEEDEEEPINIPDEQEVNDNTVSLCLLGKVWTNRPYNMYGLFETMKKLWCPTKGLICRDMGANLISFQFHSRRDLERVLAMEPWHFNKHVLVLNTISSNTQPSQMQFNKTPFWIRVYDVPIIGRKETILTQIGNRFGEVLEIDSSTLDGLAKSIRIRVLLDLSKPIKRGTKIRIGKAEPYWIPVTYERLSSFCYWCGLLGHTSKDCEKLHDTEDEQGRIREDAMPYGEFMKASPMKNLKVVSNTSMGEQTNSRRALFPSSVNRLATTEKIETEADTELKKKGESKTNTDSISEILQSLSRVDFSLTKPSSEELAASSQWKIDNKSQETQPGKHITTPPLNPQSQINQAPSNHVQTKAPPNPKPNHTPSSHTPQTTLEYTPTAELRAMINNQTLLNHKKPTIPNQKIPHPNITQIKKSDNTAIMATATTPVNQKPITTNPDNTYPNHTDTTPKPPQTQTKRDSKPLAQGQCLPPPEPHRANKTWKRIGKGPKQQGAIMDVGVKRKEDQMEIDDVIDGTAKKYKNREEGNSMITAATAQQSRRTL